MEGEATILAALLGAAVGTVSGLLGERLVRTFGKITCEPREGWEPKLSFENPEQTSGYGAPLLGSPQTPFYPDQKPSSATYEFTLDFFNGKELPVGLRKIRIVFKCRGVGEVSRIPIDPTTGRKLAGISHYDSVSTINLPPRQLVSQRFHGRVGKADALALTDWKTARFVAEYPGRRWLSKGTYSKIIAKR